MQYGEIRNFQTGVAVPLSGLRSAASCGVGEFADLVPFARWASDCGMQLIQLLPVNDTGEGASPYSALSAFALHPVHLHLQALPGAEPFATEISAFADGHRRASRLDWVAVVRFKRHMLHRIFTSQLEQHRKDKALATWMAENAWVRPYAAFCLLKEENDLKPWFQWPHYRDPIRSRVDSLWEKHPDQALFFSWCQMHAEAQFEAAAAELDQLGVRLKGDIPILLSEDSADVWYERKYFDLSNRSGAPPDMFCQAGQNWRFPAYRWDVMDADDFSWWRARLRQAAKFYHAYRIDHVLGFFRIWQIPEEQETGMLGRFVPSLPLLRTELLAAGFAPSTLEYLENPTFPDAHIRGLLEGTGCDGQPWLTPVGGGWKVNREIFDREGSILGTNEPQALKDALLRLYWDRVLMRFPETGENYQPYWYWYESHAFLSLPVNEQEKLRAIIERVHHQQENFWAEQGRRLLVMMREETDMLVCAEDLGVVPECVPSTLKELGILSLKIERWSRDWKQPGAPWIPVGEYPRLSVCSPGTHDTSTLRGYWEEEGWPREAYGHMLGLPHVPDYLTEELAQSVLARNLASNSLLCIIPLQDWLALRYDRRSMVPAEERINVPGSLDPTNWTWRMPHAIEELVADADLRQRIRSATDPRTQRPL